MEKIVRIESVIIDYVACFIAWILFYTLRVSYLEGTPIAFSISDKQILGALTISIFWVLLFAFLGSYLRLIRSRLKELFYTFLHTLTGSFVVFFAFIFDDNVINYKQYYVLFTIVFFLHFVCVWIFRLIRLKRLIIRIKRRQGIVHTLMIGDGETLNKGAKGFLRSKESFIYKIFGILVTDKSMVNNYGYKVYEATSEINALMKTLNIKQVVLLFKDRKQIQDWIIKLADYDVDIKVLAQDTDVYFGYVKTTAIYQSPFIDVRFDNMSFTQQIIKFIIDKLTAISFIILFFPVYIIIGIAIKLDSKGPILFFQERIGYKGNSFNIIKFRSMVENAEHNTPQLSSENDSRVTKLGKVLRKLRLDETPQFFNVLLGQMSLVGPRPERQFFINQIIERAPEYKLIRKIKPGITSWGQVKYGYAKTVDQMIARLKYDLLYLENQSIYLDFKILIYTVKVVIKKEGF